MLGDFLQKLFNKDSSKWNTLKDKDKEGFFIITNRMMSIKHPILANEFNHFYINKSRTVDYWHLVMSRQHFKVPGWVWTKTKFKEENKKKETTLEDYEDELILKYLELNKIGKKELKEAYKLFKIETINELEKFKLFQSGANKIK